MTWQEGIGGRRRGRQVHRPGVGAADHRGQETKRNKHGSLNPEPCGFRQIWVQRSAVQFGTVLSWEGALTRLDCEQRKVGQVQWTAVQFEAVLSVEHSRGSCGSPPWCRTSGAPRALFPPLLPLPSLPPHPLRAVPGSPPTHTSTAPSPGSPLPCPHLRLRQVSPRPPQTVRWSPQSVAFLGSVSVSVVVSVGVSVGGV